MSPRLLEFAWNVRSCPEHLRNASWNIAIGGRKLARIVGVLERGNDRIVVVDKRIVNDGSNSRKKSFAGALLGFRGGAVEESLKSFVVHFGNSFESRWDTSLRTPHYP